MIGIYFSGTGNTQYCIETLLREYDPAVQTVSIEDETVLEQIREQEEMVLAYPVQFSNIPKILQDFVAGHPTLWNNKKIFILATMGMFSGDGTGILARLLTKYGATITGGLHVRMPNSIADKKSLPFDQNREMVVQAEQKIRTAVQQWKQNRPPQEGLGGLAHLAGLFGQRLYFSRATKQYSSKLKIDPGTCTGCGKCVSVCPMKNISLRGTLAVPGRKCTMCYRCISLCPVQAITLLGKQVYEPRRVEQYLG